VGVAAPFAVSSWLGTEENSWQKGLTATFSPGSGISVIMPLLWCDLAHYLAWFGELNGNTNTNCQIARQKVGNLFRQIKHGVREFHDSLQIFRKVASIHSAHKNFATESQPERPRSAPV
jgi:hypothetical protein